MGMPSTVLLLCLQTVMSSRICISGVLFSSWKDTSQTGLGPCLNSLNLITSFKVLFPNIVTFWGLGAWTSVSDFGERGHISVHNTWPGPDFLSSRSVRTLFFHYTKSLLFFFLRFFFFWWVRFLKSLLNLLQYCFYFMGFFFNPEACGTLTLQPRIELAPLALEGEVLTTGPPGKSQVFVFGYSLFLSIAKSLPISSSTCLVLITHLFCHKRAWSYTLGHAQGHNNQQNLVDVSKELALQASVNCNPRIPSNN